MRLSLLYNDLTKIPIFSKGKPQSVKRSLKHGELKKKSPDYKL